MALIKTPDGGFYVNDDEFEVNYSTNSISLTGQGGGGVAGVSSFNGRTGAVVPVATDYPPSLIGAVNKAGDTMTGDLDMGGHTVTGISDALEDTDALPKGQADDIYVNVTGDTMTGALNMNGNAIQGVPEPVNSTDVATKAYVDILGDSVNDIIDGTEMLPYLPDNGGTLTGPLNMGSNKITMGGTPTETTDVTNKGYVDGVVGVVSDEVDKILDGTSPVVIPAATATKAGLVRQATAVPDAEGATDTALAATVNNLLAALRTAGILASN